MSIELVTLLMFGSLVVLLILGLPFAFAAGGIAVLSTLLLWEPGVLMLVLLRVWDTMGSFALLAIPMFVFMSLMLERAGIAEKLYEAIYHWVGSLRGGLAIATVIICCILAAMVGVIGAGVVMMGLIALPAMLKHRYHKDIALGCIMAGGSLGALIPPSMQFIIYAMVAGVSVGRLFAGGLFPGLLLGGLFIAYIGVRGFFQPNIAPAMPRETVISLRQKLGLLKELILPTALIVLVLGSIFAGAATPSEAAGVGALGAMVCAAIHRRLNWQNVKEVMIETTKITCMILWLIFGATSLIGVYTLAGGARFMEEIILGLPLCPWGILIAMQIVLIIMGMLVDSIGIILLAGPIFAPLATELGFDPIWFGVLFQMNLQIAFLSPPFGYALFYMKGVAPPDITMGDIYRSVGPFIVLQIVGLALVMIFPQIALWLPNMIL